MILTGPRIQQAVEDNTITIQPFDTKLINPNSYDVRLGETLVIYTEQTLDSAKINPVKEVTIPSEGYVLKPEVLYLGHTQEVIGSNHYVPIIRGKSSTGRVGLFVHITADLIDIGSVGQLTLMLHAVQPLRVYPGMRIGQITFWKTHGDIILYDGKYQASVGPVSSQAHKEFEL